MPGLYFSFDGGPTIFELIESFGAAIENEDSNAIDELMERLWENGPSREYVPILIRLLDTTCHTRHEDIALALQDLKDSRAIDPLYHAAHASHDYLAFDENFGLARKCTWALADIGTDEAKARLIQISAEPNEVVAAFAQKRLDNWDLELDRKRTNIHST